MTPAARPSAHDDLHDPERAADSPRLRLHRARVRARRAVLRRRRPLAALLTGAAVAAGLTATAGPSEEVVPVLVAARDLPAGASLGRGDLVESDHRPGSVPAGAFAPGQVAELAGAVLAAPVGAGEPVTEVRLVGAALAAGHPGRRAVPVRLPDLDMVALLEPGDLLDLVATDGEDGSVATVAAGVPVLAVPTTAATSAMPGGVVVVGLTAAQVAPVASATLRQFVTYTWAER